MTKNPITKPWQSPMPTGKRMQDLDEREQEEVREHKNYSPSEDIELNPGINEFKNNEHAEYFYFSLGNPDNGGIVLAGNSAIPIQNKNFVFEVDKNGEEIKENLWVKYRSIKTPMINRSTSQDQFNIKE
ncbi:MAG: hypothetical protein Q8L27_04230 [archaeon]|nr:hypothetical protein [archaeon]